MQTCDVLGYVVLGSAHSHVDKYMISQDCFPFGMGVRGMRKYQTYFFGHVGMGCERKVTCRKIIQQSPNLLVGAICEAHSNCLIGVSEEITALCNGNLKERKIIYENTQQGFLQLTIAVFHSNHIST